MKLKKGSFLNEKFFKKVFYLGGILILIGGCTWPIVKVGGNDYLLSPFPPEQPVTLPQSASGSGIGSSGIQPPPSVPQ